MRESLANQEKVSEEENSKARIDIRSEHRTRFRFPIFFTRALFCFFFSPLWILPLLVTSFLFPIPPHILKDFLAFRSLLCQQSCSSLHFLLLSKTFLRKIWCFNRIRDISLVVIQSNRIVDRPNRFTVKLISPPKREHYPRQLGSNVHNHSRDYHFCGLIPLYNLAITSL